MIGLNLHPSAERATPAGMADLGQCVQLQADIADLSKRDAVDLVRSRFPHLSKSWINRNFHYLTELSADALAVVITYADPVGEIAANRASRKAGDRR